MNVLEVTTFFLHSHSFIIYCPLEGNGKLEVNDKFPCLTFLKFNKPYIYHIS